MRNGTCYGCGVPVTYAETADGTSIVLERHESAGGPGRYAVWTDNIARPVSAGAAVLAQELHACAARRRHESGK